MPDLFVATKPTQEPSKPQDLTVDSPTNSSPPLPNQPGQKPPYLFSSFSQNPIGISFKEQEEDEDILLFVRRHFITNVPWIFTSVILAFIPFIIFYLNRTFPFIGLETLPKRFTDIFIIFYYLVLATYVFIQFITWYFNISLITNKRVIDISFADLVYKNVSATKIDLVQDVSFTQVGVISSIFNFGNVLIQTAGTLDNFEFSDAPYPEQIVKIVEDLIGKGGKNV
jgi:hypothetical protein